MSVLFTIPNARFEAFRLLDVFDWNPVTFEN
jgi:hypothetical protein